MNYIYYIDSSIKIFHDFYIIYIPVYADIHPRPPSPSLQIFYVLYSLNELYWFIQ